MKLIYLHLVNGKRTLISTTVARFEALFFSGYKPHRVYTHSTMSPPKTRHERFTKLYKPRGNKQQFTVQLNDRRALLHDTKFNYHFITCILKKLSQSDKYFVNPVVSWFVESCNSFFFFFFIVLKFDYLASLDKRYFIKVSSQAGKKMRFSA